MQALERRIDKMLQQILGKLPAYEGLPISWAIYPYNMLSLLLLFTICAYGVNQSTTGIFRVILLLIIGVLTLWCLRELYYYWLKRVPFPRSYDDFVDFSNFVSMYGNNYQIILIGEYMLHKFPHPNEELEIIRINVATCYYSIDNEETGFRYATDSLTSDQPIVRLQALQLLRDHYIRVHDETARHMIEDNIKTLRIEMGEQRDLYLISDELVPISHVDEETERLIDVAISGIEGCIDTLYLVHVPNETEQTTLVLFFLDKVLTSNTLSLIEELLTISFNEKLFHGKAEIFLLDIQREISLQEQLQQLGTWSKTF
jgi:hypothetical protein